jgi:hypothetical protein
VSPPRVSLVIPAFNAAGTIARALESLDNAVGRGLAAEVIIIDDGSHDHTRDVACRALSRLPSHIRPRYEHQANAGPSAARQHGIELARGDWIIFLDADDELLPGAVDKLLADPFADRHLVFGGYRSVTPTADGGLRVRDKPAPSLTGEPARDFAAFVRRKMPALTPGTAAVRRKVALAVGFDPRCRVNEDLVFFGHVLAGGPAASLPGQDGLVLLGHRRPGSLRHDPARVRESETVVEAALFDPAHLDPELMRHRRRFAARIARDAATIHHRNRDASAAAASFARAARLDPMGVARHPRQAVRWARAVLCRTS